MTLRQKLIKALPPQINTEWEFLRGRYYERLGKKDLKGALKRWYRYIKGRELNIDNPKTFSEKIQWLKIYDATSEKTRLCDKFLVRPWIEEKIGGEYLVPLLGVWDNFDDIDFHTLPRSFVLKTNHSSGWNIIVRDKYKLDLKSAKRRMDRWMSTDFAYFMGFEMQYSRVKRKIIAEKYIGGKSNLLDYKVICFHGEPYVIWIDSDRYSDHRRNLYDFDWKLQPYTMLVPNMEQYVPAPKNLSKMREIARILSQGFIHSRVDFFEVDGKLYFGEMTFTSGSGLSDFDPPYINRQWGDMMHLPERFEIFHA